jgi:hypothetical protein
LLLNNAPSFTRETQCPNLSSGRLIIERICFSTAFFAYFHCPKMEEQYSTKEEIAQALRKKQNELGIVLSIKSSNQTRLVLKCDRGGVT